MQSGTALRCLEEPHHVSNLTRRVLGDCTLGEEGASAKLAWKHRYAYIYTYIYIYIHICIYICVYNMYVYTHLCICFLVSSLFYCVLFFAGRSSQASHVLHLRLPVQVERTRLDLAGIHRAQPGTIQQMWLFVCTAVDDRNPACLHIPKRTKSLGIMLE